MATQNLEASCLATRSSLTALNLRVLRDIEAKMPEGGDRYDGASVVPQPKLDRRERYHARRLSLRGRLRRVETDAPWFARRTVLYGSVAEGSSANPQSVVREPAHVLRQPEVHVAYRASYRDTVAPGASYGDFLYGADAYGDSAASEIDWDDE